MSINEQSRWEKKYPSVDEKLAWYHRCVAEVIDLRKRGHQWDALEGIKTLERTIQRIAEQAGR